MQKLQKDMQTAERKLGNPGFLDKAPAEVVQEVREKLAAQQAEFEKLQQNLHFFEEIRS